MKKSMMLLLFIASFTCFGLEFYLSTNYSFSTPFETLDKTHPDYDDEKDRFSYDYLLRSERDVSTGNPKPDKSTIGYNFRAGAYLWKRNRVGLDYHYTRRQVDGNIIGNDSLSAYDYTSNIKFSTITATFTQEMWAGMYFTGKLGWGWRFENTNREYPAGVTPDFNSSSGMYSHGPAFGLDAGWNQKLWYKFSLSLDFSWLWHVYIVEDIKKARIFSINIGLNYGLHYHNKTKGKS